MEFFIGRILPYLAVTCFAVGLIYRIGRWNSAPIPHEQVLYPAPETTKDVVMEIATETIFFKKIFNTDKALWFGSWFFHIGLFLALGGHLVGIPFEGKQFVYLGTSVEVSKELSHILGSVAGIFMFVGLIYLLIRRLTILEVKKISDPSDYFDAILLIAIALTGNYMRFLAPIEYVEAKNFVIGILTFTPVALPTNGWFVLHFTLVMILLIYFPFSKLFHFIGTFYTQAISTKIAPPKPASLKVEKRTSAKVVTTQKGGVSY
ncbi:nitrate reductase [Thermanaerosceptrum fracticalcis]|uniref:Nitrate reductase n=1 Tax=Thermanaerosceptrum fracticalcis TaxID=1712410 RepID=A0A7G6E1T4_THEFR|nr:respiratory nitrate reductase subunit gamma [Thermanaerosceptrum fracticalcis]QNB46038.1 nitrate reductase [Thermanaerosceptrum fracticalcis]